MLDGGTLERLMVPAFVENEFFTFSLYFTVFPKTKSKKTKASFGVSK